MTGPPSPPEVRVVIAGGMAFGRYAIRQALSDCQDILVVAEAGSVGDAARDARQLEADVLVYDSSTGIDRGLGASLAVIHRQAPRTRLLLIANGFAGRALAAGVSPGISEVLNCETTGEELIRAVRRVATTVDQPAIWARRARAGRRRLGSSRVFSRQEVSVVSAIADGATDREIADRLAIPIATVKARVRSILRKTRAVNRAEAITAAFRSRVLE